MKAYWFDEKWIGLGFGRPLTVEGWVALIGLLIVVGMSAYVNDIFIKRDKRDWCALFSKPMIRFVLDTIIIVTIFSILFADRVKGGLVWH